MNQPERDHEAILHGAAPSAPEWVASAAPVEYPAALSMMEERVRAIASGRAAELIWLLEHPALYTAGTSARMSDVLSPRRLPVFESGRGGQVTYHGPGQRIAYVMLDVRRRFGGDVRAFVRALEACIIHTLRKFGVEGERRAGRVGIWVRRPDLGAGREDKIAAIGVRIQRGISLHGLSLNVAPDLTHYDGIVPCGIRDQGVTSLSALGCDATIEDVDGALREAFGAVLRQMPIDAGFQ